MPFANKNKKSRAFALLMAIGVIAILAVIGFGFVTATRMESRVTRAISYLNHARLAALAAVQLCQGSFLDDVLADPSTSAGPLADHFGETLYQSPVPAGQQTILELDNLRVKATASEAPYPFGGGSATAKVRDESSKMNLNAFGNLSLWYAQGYPTSKTAADITDATQQVYHGVNERFSSFEVSFEEFFYYLFKTGHLWNSYWPTALQLTYDAGDPGSNDNLEARIRCANLARSICLYRYGPDGKPGTANTDDDDDNALLSIDDIDNDGDGTNNEADEGVDEPDEYNPYKLAGDDRKFTALSQLKDAFLATYTLASVSVPAAVSYAGAQADDQEAEANRIFLLVRPEITIDSYSLDIQSASIDDTGHDGYDNDGDGLIDETESQDTDGAKTLADLIAQLNDGKTVYGTYDAATDTFTNRIDIVERPPTDTEAERQESHRLQAAYLYLKLRLVVPRFSLKNALDIVDYRDTDCIPTFIAAANVQQLTADDPTPDRRLNEDLWGMEGLHVTEVGMYMDVGTNQFARETGPWSGTSGTITYTADSGHTDEASRTSDVAISAGAALKQGHYIIRVTVDVPPNGKIKFKTSDGSLEKEATTDGTFFFGPLVVDGTGKGSLKLVATSVDGTSWADLCNQGENTFSVSAFQVFFPYVEIMNWSRKDIDITKLALYTGTKAIGDVNDGDSGLVLLNSGNITNTNHPPAYAAGVSAAPDDHIAGQRRMAAGFTPTHGGGYGFLVVAYDEATFARNFTGGGDGDATWGDADDEDFPLWTVSKGGANQYMSNTTNPFYDGWDGSQQVQILYRVAPNTYYLVGGGVLDGLSAANGTGKALDSDNLALDRTLFFGNPWYSKSFFADKEKWTRDIVDETASPKVPRVSPGRWNRIDDSSGKNWWVYDPNRFQEVTDKGHHDMPCVTDRGYFRSAAEVVNVNAGEHKNATFTYAPPSGHEGYFPGWNKLVAYTVAAREPARVNLNTASAPVMEAAAIGLTPDAQNLITLRTANTIYRAQEFCELDAIKAVYYDDAPADDDDGDNAAKEFCERELWLIKASSVFTLRGRVFSVHSSGAVTDGSGNIRAIHKLESVLDRGRAVREDGDDYQPVVRLLRVNTASD